DRDTRRFQLASVDNAGNQSARTTALVGTPRLAGLVLARATAVLAARGLEAGRVTAATSSRPKNTVLAPTTVRLLPQGASVDLTVSSGKGRSTLTRAAGGKLTFAVVGTRSFSLAKRKFVGARVNISRAAQMTASLVTPKGRTAYRWRFRVGAGATLVRLTVPRTVTRSGAYHIVWRAVAGSQTAQRRITVRIATAGAAKPRAKPGREHTVGVLVAGDSLPSAAGGYRATTHLIKGGIGSLFTLVVTKRQNVQV